MNTTTDAPYGTYVSATTGRRMDRLIPENLAEEIATLFESIGQRDGITMFSPQTRQDRPYSECLDKDGRYTPPPPKYLLYPEIADKVEGLPKLWTVDVNHILGRRMKERDRAAHITAFSAIENEAIREYALSLIDTRGVKAQPEYVDLTRTLRPNMGRTYEPVGDCGAVLKAKESVSLVYEQQAYADIILTAIPYEITGTFDRDTAARNLQRLGDAMRTHNGLAGSGCTYRFIIHDGFVVMETRVSISD